MLKVEKLKVEFHAGADVFKVLIIFFRDRFRTSSASTLHNAPISRFNTSLSQLFRLDSCVCESST